MAQLAATVYVRDPQTHQTVRLEPGTSPEARLAALVTNPAAWVDGKLPRLPKKATDSKEAGDPTGDGQDDASGADSAAGSDQTAPAKKTAARKTAASKPARGRDAADEGSSGD
ncbi:hypothetical protein P1P75_12010 [Streptomyces sp. ID05-39B]|uniref:hypothetical protein n=1 Tax=Streptomyces sp. ID05-39B TaxID=3028664 RepID=UPI0029BE1461|nr:hypothetical protein [Streptomyces sp. ID05-39B]MDX3527148.1 hypothetical protein [Streptomyces sp. ID05-39B]